MVVKDIRASKGRISSFCPYKWSGVSIVPLLAIPAGSSLLSIAMIHTVIKSNLGRKRFISLKIPHRSLPPKEVRAGTEAEAQDHLPRGSITPSGLGPSHINHFLKNAPQPFPQASLVEVFSRLTFPLPRGPELTVG